MTVAARRGIASPLINDAPYILSQFAVPAILAPNGTVAANGTITLGTALPTIYSGGAWVRLPAGAVVGDAAGTLHYAVFSSTTVGVVYTLTADAASAFTPYIPTVALVAATGSNAAYTQTTASDITLANITVPGGAMGANGGLRTGALPEWNNSAGAKIAKLMHGGGSIIAPSRTTTTNDEWLVTIRNITASSQIYSNSTSPSAGVSVSRKALNTAVDQALTFTGQLAVATDYIVLAAFTVEVLPG